MAAPLDASKLQTELVGTDKPVPEPNSPEQWSQSYATDHMLTAPWDSVRGWGTPKIGPYSNLSLSPIASALNYATSCFEGMKLYRGYDGKARLFRPNLNAARMLRSAQRVCLPEFDPAELEKLIIKFAEVEARKWAPASRPGTSIYLRPVLIATQPTIALQIPNQALLYIAALAFPNIDDRHLAKQGMSGTSASDDVPRETKSSDEPVKSSAPGLKLWASSAPHVRTWPGGAGAAKVGVNYGPTLPAQQQAAKKEFDQVLWLYPGSQPENPLVTEAGGSNFFVLWKTPEGKMQLITAPLSHGLILPGVTRQSILELAKAEFGSEMEVVEKDYGIEDLVQAFKEGRLLEAFAAGTAYFVTPVEKIAYKDVDVNIPLNGAAAGKYTKTIRDRLMDIQYGKTSHKWGVVLNEV